MKTKLLAMTLLAGSALFAETHFSIGVGVGGYGNGYYAAQPAPVVRYATPRPGPGFTWVEGFWGPRHAWRPGYWARTSYGREYVVEPRFDRDRDRDRDRHEDYRRDEFRHDDNRYEGNVNDSYRPNANGNNRFDNPGGRR